jgi:LPS-assembly lipoprotein
MILRSALLGLSALALAGCGFTPAYAPVKGGGIIEVAEIEGRTGHYLHRELSRTVSRGMPNVVQQSELSIDLRESIVRLGFRPDQTASRSDYIGRADWVLTGVDGKVIARGRAQEAAGFNFADAAYADVVAQQAAQEKVAYMLAESIRKQMLASVGRPVSEPVGDPDDPIVAPGAQEDFNR